MNFWNNLFEGSQGAWSGGIAHSMIIISLVIALGKILGKYKVKGISLGVTWVLFVGIVFSHFNMTLDANLIHFLKEFGLILFVFSIGLQVGPGFVSSLKSGGLGLNLMAVAMCLFGAGCAIAISKLSGIEMTTMTGIMSGAVTNTPGLGAAQTAYFDSCGQSAPDMALGYALAYPLGVVGTIVTFIVIKATLYRNFTARPKKATASLPDEHEEKELAQKRIIVRHHEVSNTGFISRRFIISRRSLNGMTPEKLRFEEMLGVSVTRIRRAGVELHATGSIRLQYGDMVTVVGTEEGVKEVEKILGNSVKRLDEPNLIPIFIGIALGVVLGSIPVAFPGIPQPVKLGLAGGPLVVSILLSHFGPRFNFITYTTPSANLMLREIGICLFLACVGLEAGNGFVDTLVNKGGYVWIAYGAIITMVPQLIAALIGRYLLHLDYSTLIGVISGSCTNPPALAFAGEQDKSSDAAAVGYATVYPLSMFMRVLIAQLMVLMVV